MDEEISVRRGEQITIQLLATNRWSVDVRDADAILQSVEPQGVEPQGVVDAQGQMVEWRYIAVRQGAATLVFAGRPVVRPGQKSPHFVMARTFIITVTP